MTRIRNKVVAVGMKESNRLKVDDWKDIIQVSVGLHHSVGLKSDGTVKVVQDYDLLFIDGSNSYLEPEEVTEWKNIIKVCAGDSYTVGLTSEGKVLVSSYDFDASSDYTKWNNVVDLASCMDFAIMLKDDGKLEYIANAYLDDVKDVLEWTDVVKIAVIIDDVYALKSDGTILTNSENKELALKTWNDVLSLDDKFTITESGEVIANFKGSCNEDNVSSWRDIISVSYGPYHTLGLKSDGTVLATGYHYYCATDVEHLENVVDIEAAGGYTSIIFKDGTIDIVGSHNNDDALPKKALKPFVEDSFSEWKDIINVKCSDNYIVALKKGGTIIETDGIHLDWYKRYYDEEWTDLVKIDNSDTHVVGLKSDGTVLTSFSEKIKIPSVKEWKDIIDVVAGHQFTAALTKDGTVLLELGEYSRIEGQDLNTSEWKDIIQISAAYNYIVGLKSDGTVVSSGVNQDGRCDFDNWIDIKAIATSKGHCVGLKSDGTVVATGDNEHGQCEVSGWKDVKKIAVGDNHTVGLI